jgi:hypothetical protein
VIRNVVPAVAVSGVTDTAIPLAKTPKGNTSTAATTAAIASVASRSAVVARPDAGRGDGAIGSVGEPPRRDGGRAL